MYGGREEDAYFASPWCKGNNFHNLDSSFPKDASYQKCNTRPDTFFVNERRTIDDAQTTDKLSL